MAELPLISPMDRALFLRAHPFFQAEPRAVVAIAEHSREAHFATGEHLVRAGEENDTFFVLVEGSVAAWYGERRLYDIEPPAAVGLLPVLAGRALDSSIIALEETTALELEIDTLLQILEDHFGLVLSMTSTLAQFLADAEEEAGLAPGKQTRPDVLPAALDGPLDLVDRLSHVRRHPLFANANLGLLAELFRGDIVRTYDDGEQLCRVGEEADAFEVLIDGVVLLQDGEQQRQGYIDVPGVVGWRDLVTRRDRTWEGTASGPVRTLHVPRDLYMDVLEDHFDHTMAVVALLAKRYLRVFSRRRA